ncbi:helix-turn-helix domain-containing protein [Paracoccus jiaweipingae]|uniref:helix-turn-helix domain-containing protein n=1 Tax=unclassified Paracoccus (in: a-proteobacteria) TaxID=2688777 RepID=UPI0037A80168
MLMLPIPAFTGLILLWLALRSALRRRQMLALFLTACAGQSLGIALALGYDVQALRPLLPVTAAAIPALAWVTFRSLMLGRMRPTQMALHLAGPGFVLFARLFAPQTVDVAVAGLFAGYGVAILAVLRSGDLPLARLEAGGLPALIWRGLGWALIFSAASDGLIAVAFMAGRPELAGVIVSLGSSLSLLALGLFSVQPAASGEAEDRPARPDPDIDTSEDAQIIARLDALLSRETLHLDPNLTLSRLARRLRLPDKRLSAAVNRATGGNVSRYINGFRIRHACGLIGDGASVTQAMLDSGFNTKSNFNREFTRVTGTTPSQWRAQDQSR